MRRKSAFIEGEFYHLYNRGVDKRVIFTCQNDYERFLALLYLCNSKQEVRMNNLATTSLESRLRIKRTEPLVAIGAFCLMPNHFHLLCTPYSSEGLSQFMKKLQTGYSMYFNIKYERSGSLFEGPFKDKHVLDDSYLKYLFSYIHLNPAKLINPRWKESKEIDDRLLRFIETYPYSSYSAYHKNEHSITDPEAYPSYFSSQQALRAHVTDWLAAQN